MNVLDWLLSGDPSIKALISRSLFNQEVPYDTAGIISRYLGLYDHKLMQWGEGVYSPKWNSTHYTMLELKNLQIDPANPIYQEGALRLLNLMWYNNGKVGKTRHQDTCVVGMILNMVCYGKITDPRIDEMVDHLLEHELADGGWNCEWERKPFLTHSSVHTTLSVIEGFWEYEKNGYHYRIDDVICARTRGEEYLLRKKLYLRESTRTPMFDQITECHYPQRWKYDVFKALGYFVDTDHAYDDRMADALAIVEKKIRNGIMPAGPRYPGKVHFAISTEDRKRLTTFTALRALKKYRPEIYERCLSTPI